MTKTQSKYWAVKHGDRIIFEGTFSDCWDWLVAKFGDQTVSHITASGIKITRIK